MEDITRDERFAHVTWDPKFRSMPNKDRKVKIDNRFKAMFTDPSFQVDYTVDKRGRPFHRTTEENLREFYDLHTDEEEESDVDDALALRDSEEEEKQAEEEDEEEEIRIDLARGQGNLPTSESEDSDWSFESEDEGINSKWTELDADAPKAEFSTRRLALCNMDWSRISARDLYVLFNSFKPVSGVVRSVRIYPSEFGLKRMAEEEVAGPVELQEDIDDPEAGYELIKGSKRWMRQMAKMREYEINRLRYYYAVIDCDSVSTAEAIYNNCDGNEYQSSSVKIDLRFIPDDMVFDDSLAKDTAGIADCNDSYKPVHFQTAAVSQTKVKLTWDDDDFHRRRKIQQAFSAEAIEKEDEFCDLLASSSSSSSDEEEQKTNCQEDEQHDTKEEEDNLHSADVASEPESEAISVVSLSKRDRAEVYRQLLKSIESKQSNRKSAQEQEEEDRQREDYDLEVTFEPALQSKAEEVRGKNRRDQENLTPWQRYLQKRKEARRQKKMERKRLRDEAKARRYESASEIEDGKEYTDQEGHSPQGNDLQSGRTDELELLVADSEEKEHYHLKSLIKEARQKGKYQSDRIGEAPPPEDGQFKLNVCDKRFDAIYTSHLFNIDPSDPSFKKTKGTEALLEEKRRRAKRRNVELTNDDAAALPKSNGTPCTVPIYRGAAFDGLAPGLVTKRLANVGLQMDIGQPEYVEHSWLPIDQYDDVDLWDDADNAVDLSRPTLNATYKLCVRELLLGGIGAKIAQLFLLCLVRRISSSVAVIPESLKQLFGICLGVYVLHLWHDAGAFWCVLNALALYAWMLLCCHLWPSKLSVSVACFSIGYVLLCQFLLLSAVQFNSLSGSLMIMSMKSISLTFDYDAPSLWRNQLRLAPFFGYMLDIGTAMNGPWITYGSYRNSFSQAGLRSVLSSIALAFCTGLLSFAFLVYSACLSWWLFPASDTRFGRLLVAFRDAQAFRSSHYFVSFLSQTSALLAGYTFSLEKPSDSTIFAIVDPLRCELPRSLVDVVVSWNRSMHLFLKKYVFKPLSGYGRFVALFLTYCVSSLLHGVNFQLSAVLLSLGLYTYSEHLLREKLSARLSACVGVRRCNGPCSHARKETHPISRLCNGAFLLLSIFHLAYLGMVYDSSDLQEQGYNVRHTIGVWSNVYFISHIVFLLTYLLAKCLP
uniref:NUC153 domain-containing protein n=1 Tax=Trichuris muris TaxID=70415 RepID=A0A5S6R5U5_TRIMR